MMNQINLKKIIIILLFAIFVVETGTVLMKNYNFTPNELTTDSGFDSDFGGGGSSSSSSSFGGSSYGGSSGGSNELTLGEAIFIEVFFTICYWIVIFSELNNKSQKTNDGTVFFVIRTIVLIVGTCFTPYVALVDMILFFILAALISPKSSGKNVSANNLKFNTQDVSSEQLQLYGIKESLDELKKKVYTSYVEIQEAWSENNIDKARHLLSDTMYNTYKMQIITMINKHQRNAMSDFKYVNAYINEVSEKENNIIIKTSLNVQCRDYLINTTNDQVIRGNQGRMNDYYYSLTFILGKSNNITHCPNCTSKLKEQGTSVKCEYCGSIIEREINELVLIDKKMVKQGIKR